MLHNVVCMLSIVYHTCLALLPVAHSIFHIGVSKVELSCCIDTKEVIMGDGWRDAGVGQGKHLKKWRLPACQPDLD